MEQDLSDHNRPKPYRVPPLLPPRVIPSLGLASLQGVILRTIGKAEKLAREAAESDKANVFANLILSKMLIEPAMARSMFAVAFGGE
jgi:hypothetical protein